MVGPGVFTGSSETRTFWGGCPPHEHPLLLLSLVLSAPGPHLPAQVELCSDDAQSKFQLHPLVVSDLFPVTHRRVYLMSYLLMAPDASHRVLTSFLKAFPPPTPLGALAPSFLENTQPLLIFDSFLAQTPFPPHPLPPVQYLST